MITRLQMPASKAEAIMQLKMHDEATLADELLTFFSGLSTSVSLDEDREQFLCRFER